MKYNKQHRTKRQTKFTFFEVVPPYGENDLKQITNVFKIYSARLRRRIEIRTPDLYWYETDKPPSPVIQKAEDMLWWFFGKFITAIYWAINITIIFGFLFILNYIGKPD